MRFSSLFLWIALLPALAPAAEPVACNPGFFAQLTQRYLPGLAGRLSGSSPVVKAVQGAVESKFALRGHYAGRAKPEWIDWKKLDERQRSLLESLPKLSSQERADLIPLVKGAEPETAGARELQNLILLGLYDRESWAKLIPSLYEGGLHAHLAADYLPVIAGKMPESLRHDFLKRVGNIYHGLTKDKTFTYASNAPKRIADLYFKHALKGDELIKAEITRGRTPAEAFRAYVTKVQEYVRGEDYYSADQTLAIMEEVRKALKKSAAEGALSGQADPVLWVGGSLPNGRATFLESDIDIGTNIELPDSVKAAIEKGVKSYVTESRPDSGIQAAFKKDRDLAFWTHKHPVAFRIRPGGVDLAVVSPNGELDMRPIR